MFMYTIKEREDILTLIDMVTGARVTHSYLRFGGVRDDLPKDLKKNHPGTEQAQESHP